MPKCEICGKQLPKGTKKVLDPYDLDVHGIKAWRYLCGKCEQELSDDI